MVGIACFDNAFSGILELEASTVEGRRLQPKKERKENNTPAKDELQRHRKQQDGIETYGTKSAILTA